MGPRLTAFIPLVASVITVALTIVLLASGQSPSNANDDFWIALNLSGVGGNLVEIQPATPSSNDPLGGIINGIPGLGPILDNITSSIGSGLSDLQGSIVGTLTSALDIKDMYILYVTKMCQGNFQNAADPDGDVNIDSCYSYRDGGAGLLSITKSIPSDFVIGTADVSVPLVASLKSILSTIVNLAVGAATAMEVLLVIGCVASGLTAISSVLSLLHAQSRLFVISSLGFSALAASMVFVLAALVTGVVVAGSSVIGGLGSGFSLHVKEGVTFLAIIWVAAVLSIVAASIWFAIWFVEFRESAFSRRSRTDGQIGNWWGIFGEVRKDIKVDGHLGVIGGPCGERRSSSKGKAQDLPKHQENTPMDSSR